MALSDDDIAHLKSWVGRTQTVEDIIATDRVAAMAATLDLERTPEAGEALPPGWHWLFFNGAARQGELGPDGHPRRGGFLPPVPLPRRMWAGGRITVSGTLPIGAPARRESRILSVDAKRGRSGDLVFVTVQHTVHGGRGAALEEEHDIVYREAPAPGALAPQPEPAPSGAVWRREIKPDPVLLFRYSALTFNGHRIHYDHPYVTQVEGYPGLIVHGPLIATLLLDLLARQKPHTQLRRFRFRAKSPLFDTAAFHVNGVPAADETEVRLWAEGPGAVLAMDAAATIDNGS
ncbi:MAG TPA: acyl-CoA dehydrogenase [Alphaproteobacteria bacterium]|nr:acyl-CoA dehydrogenase [Alphaproteobacteria bacterium]